ncbi:MAG: hypothetical protein AAB336_09260 [Acidobacteriota bacterium]
METAKPNSKLAIWALTVGIFLPLVNSLIIPLVAGVIDKKNLDLFDLILTGIFGFIISGFIINLICLVLSLFSLTFKNCNRLTSQLAGALNLSLSVLTGLAIAFGKYILPQMGRW